MKKINVDKNLVRHVSSLARLSIREDEISEYEKNFKEIVQYVEQLGEIETKGVDPLYNPMTENIGLYSKRQRKERDDQVDPSLPVDEVLKNAPGQKNKQFKIKAVIEES